MAPVAFGEHAGTGRPAAHIVLGVPAVADGVFTITRSPVMLQTQDEQDGNSGQQRGRSQSGSEVVHYG
jgi:hypothetical protein